VSLTSGETNIYLDAFAAAETEHATIYQDEDGNPTVAVVAPSADEFGSDLSCVDDLDELMVEVSGPTALVQALVRRLSTPRGALYDSPDYGLDLREYLHKAQTLVDLDGIPGAVRAELKKEERLVGDVECRIVSFVDSALVLSIACVAASGPFTFTVTVTAAAVLLKEAT